ncbi:MAG: type I DNA topoisomerase [Christensenellales bacterium]|nr:type I DNA topoisomerase [Clostridiales bacterium]
MKSKKHKLVIVESPAKARTVARFLGRDYKVEASQGHVRDLPKSQFGIDTEQDFAMKYITIHGRGPILAKLRKQAAGASQVYLATDPDREGEAISWHLAQALKLDDSKPLRVEFQEITKNAVKEAVKSARTIDMDRVNAQQARRALDRVVGYKISPLLWAKIKKGLSAGRVQSVAVRLIVDREDEIDAFIPEEYWDISADFEALNAKGKKVLLSARLNKLKGKKPEIINEKAALKAKDLIQNSAFKVGTVKKGTRKKSPAPPFTTSTLQQEASRKLNYTSSRTMQIVQGLYEGVELGKEGSQGLVTYIRTDSVRVSAEAVAAAREEILKAYGKEHLPRTAREYKTRSRAQDAHEAIRPTDITRTPDSLKAFLSREQMQVYRLIYNRFLASQMKNAEYETLTADLLADEVDLRYYAEHKSFPGFTAIYEEGEDDNGVSIQDVMPDLQKDDTVDIQEVHAEQHFTQPPSRYTEASLIKSMEERGIGRPSTYAPTIGTIIARGYISREKRRLYPTEMGRMVNDIMMEYFSPVVDLEFTADMESKLDEIAEGKLDWKDILRDFYPSFSEMVSQAEAQIEKVEIPDEVSDIPCEVCGTMLVYKMGRYGRFLACPRFPECRFTMPILTYIDAPCPTCGARLLEKTTRKGRKFYGCEKYPECEFTSWDKVATEKCPKCGHHMVYKYRKNSQFRLCTNETCRHHEMVEEAPEAEHA